MMNVLKEEKHKEKSFIILENVNLKKMNTFKLDITAKYFFEINDAGDIFFIFKYIKDKQEEFKSKNNNVTELACDIFKYFILGGGSNVLFLNSFYDGLIIKSNLTSLDVLESVHEGGGEAAAQEKTFLKVGSGYQWDSFVKYCCDNNFYGLENLSHIPGTVGAAPVQNIGAYGVEVSDCVFEVECYDIENQKFLILRNTEDKKECDFFYRDSIFKRKNYFIISVTFILSKEKKFNLEYKDIENYMLENKIKEKDLSILGIRNIIINIRNNKMPNWRDEKSQGTAGSFFKNIIVDENTYEKLKKEYIDLPFFKLENKYKLPSAYIIDHILNMKNCREGDVGTYKNQALIIVNYENSSGLDVYNFSENIIKKVKKLLDLNLEREVILID
jgi:UDP-N-acetylmuramate dehydrogenase